MDLHGFTWIYMDLHGFTKCVWSIQIPVSPGSPRPMGLPRPDRNARARVTRAAEHDLRRNATRKKNLHWQSLTLRSFAAIQNIQNDTIPVVMGKCLVKRIKHILWFYTEKEWKRAQGFLLPQFWIGLGMWFTESVEDRATMVMRLCPSIQPFDTMRNHRFSTFFVVFFSI